MKQQTHEPFLPFLPLDSSTASAASEELVENIIDDLTNLLRKRPADFWKVVQSETSLQICLTSYLQFARRAYDDGAPSAPSLARQQLAKQVFLVLLRMVTLEPGAGVPSASERADLIYNNWLIDIPMLMDVAVLYGRDNATLTKQLIHQVFKLQPRYAADMANTVPTVISNMADVHQTCSDAAKRLQTADDLPSLSGLIDGLAYLHDVGETLAAFAEAYQPAAVQMAGVGGGLIGLLPGIHDELLPVATVAWSQTRKSVFLQTQAVQLQRQLSMLEESIQRLLNVLLQQAFLQPEGGQKSQIAVGSSRRHDPAARERGQGLLTALQAAGGAKADQGRGLLKATAERFLLLQATSHALAQGHISIDTVQVDFLFVLLGNPGGSAAARMAGEASSSRAGIAERSHLLDQIHAVLPDYGDGFLAACLDASGQDPERVIHQLLEDSLPDALAKLDHNMPLKPQGDERKGDAKGKAKAGLGGSEEELSWRALSEAAEHEEAVISRRLHEQQQTSSHAAPPAAHKGTSFALQADPREKALAKLHAQAAQWEYDDEYDDSFDDLGGLGNIDTHADVQGDRGVPASTSAPSFIQAPLVQRVGEPKRGRALWVLDGRIYNYRKEGATPVASQAEAQQAIAAAQAAGEAIHGLGAGGNRPIQAQGETSSSEGYVNGHAGGRGEGRAGGRGRAGPGGRASGSSNRFMDQHKAAIANHHRKDRALRKMGGPAG